MDRDPYAYGFWCLVLLVVVLGAAFCHSYAIGNGPSLEGFNSSLNAWSALAQAVTSMILVVAAFLGVNAWKKQIKHEKELNIVWDTMAALRRVEMAFNDLQAHLLFLSDDADFNLSVFASGHPIKGYAKALEEQCVWMDRIVAGGTWEWVNRSSFLSMKVSSYLLLYSNTPGGGTVEFASAMAGRVQALTDVHDGFKKEVGVMDVKLKTVKQRLEH